MKRLFIISAFLLATILLQHCSRKPSLSLSLMSGQSDTLEVIPAVPIPSHVLHYVKVKRDVSVKNHFSFLDSILGASDSSLHVNEYVLVHANPWILDSLKATDYYYLKGRDVFLYDQSAKIILQRGDIIAIPDSVWTNEIRRKLKSTLIDVNIPEFTLRIIQEGDTLLKCKIRVGRNATEYLEVAKHDVDLRTPIGGGEIVRIARIPYVLNPDTGIRYDSTRRDDGRYTKMPVIPWLEPSINGMRYGTLIHPTTNEATLGKPYSHGCIGTTEADAWTIYYNAPIGTKVIFRYDLKVVKERGDTLVLKDIYKLKRKR